MPSILRNFLPVSSSNAKTHDDNSDDDDEYSVEYSFAMEYSGPPLSVSYDIPQVVPLDVNQIPTASVFSTASSMNNLSLPVIQPIVKRSNNLNMRSSSKRSKLDYVVASKRNLGEQECPLEDQENGDGCLLGGVSDGTGSSGTLGFSNSHDGSNDVSGSSDLEEPACSSEITPDEGVADCVSEASDQGNGVPAATFCDPRLSEIESESSDISEEGALHEPERPVARSDLKKRLCHRCHRGSRFTDKEVCIVCGAKYCNGCLLRVMGSMPEGRKCITCIGYPIDEARRRSLGKSSKVLKRLLTKEEIKQIMSLETSCEVNQLPPNLVSINGRALSVDDLHHLQHCKYPPKRLKPGNYWYDKVSGFWGKEGEKPSQIICAELDIGGTIQQNASNGNTNVLINGREITKSELRMLQFVGIHCEGQPHFWLSADGSYLLEGQKNVMGKLWEQPRIKLVCAALSLPIPPESRDEVNNEADKIGSDNQKAVKKILLVGCDQSGTSTIFKQTKIMYDVPFSEDERQNIKFMIQSSLYRYIAILLEGREQFEEEYLEELKRQLINQPGPSGYSDQIEEKNVYAISPGLKAFSDWLLQVKMSGNLEVIFPAATREYAPRIEELLNDSGFRAAYNRRNELCALPSVANYFLDRAVEICRVDYEPSDMDILYAEGITSSNGVASTEFSFPTPIQEGYMESVDQNDPLLRYQLIRVHSSSLGENCKWLEMFEDVDLVLYCVSLTDYDEVDINNNGVCINKMLASRKLFETIITHPTFAQKDFLLILNKFDLLEEKLERVPLSQCEWFQDFNPVITKHSNKGNKHSSNNAGSPGQRAFHYIAVQFKRLFRDLVGRKLYVAAATGLESQSVDEALKYGREILKWEEEKPSVRNEWSSESIEASTTS